MTAWNFAPYRDRSRTLRKMGWGLVMVLSAVGGGFAAAWVVNEAQTALKQQQAQLLDLKAQLSLLQQKNLQMENDQSQRQKAQESFRKMNALRQRGQDLLALHKALALRWPAGAQIQELRLEGPVWRLQGQAESGLAVQQALQGLTGVLAWQQPPALMAFEAMPQANGPALNLRYVAQARWHWPELSPKPEVNRPTPPLARE
jgi:Tfp pilus assembly protein PilN